VEEPRGHQPDGVEAGSLRCVSRGEAGVCITEFEVAYISGRLTRHFWERKMAIVRYPDGERQREMAHIWVAVKKGRRMMWADTITGTLFSEKGDCLGSKRIRIVRWI